MVEELIEQSGQKLEVAAQNSPNQTTISGAIEAIEYFEGFCLDNDISYQILDINYPFHSHFLGP